MYEIDFKKPIHVYFIGIGGISMSGLAEVLLDSGFTVSGSDSKQSTLTDDLILKGAVVHYGHQAENINSDLDLIVYTAAIKAENPEFVAANALHIPVLSRAELLGQIMKKYRTPIAVSGTHGKTTTTSMISEILLRADLDPTLSIGGILKSINGNFRIGKSDYFVTEACEYTNSFLKFFPKIAIILNVEEDHMDFFHDISEIRDSFHQFAGLLPADGTLIINRDIRQIHNLELQNALAQFLQRARQLFVDGIFSQTAHNNGNCIHDSLLEYLPWRLGELIDYFLCLGQGVVLFIRVLGRLKGFFLFIPGQIQRSQVEQGLGMPAEGFYGGKIHGFALLKLVHLPVAQGGEAAADSGDDEGEHHGGARVGLGDAAGVVQKRQFL